VSITDDRTAEDHHQDDHPPVSAHCPADRSGRRGHEHAAPRSLESVGARAIHVLLDQRVFHLGQTESELFARILSDPAPPVGALSALNKNRPPWE